MKLQIIPCTFCICKLPLTARPDISGDFSFMSKTDEELSLVCPSDAVPEQTVAREDGWRAFRLESPLDFSLTAVLAPIASILGDAHVPIFAVSTFNTDYVLVRSTDFERALSLLSDAGYETELI